MSNDCLLLVGLCILTACNCSLVSSLTCTNTPGRSGHFGGLFGAASSLSLYGSDLVGVVIDTLSLFVDSTAIIGVCGNNVLDCNDCGVESEV